MAIETNEIPDVFVKDLQTGEETTRPMTEEEHADWLATVEFINNNPTL